MAVPNYRALGLVNPLEVFEKSQKVQDVLSSRADALRKLQAEQEAISRQMKDADTESKLREEQVTIAKNRYAMGANASQEPTVEPEPQPVVPTPKPKTRVTPKQTSGPNFILNKGVVDQKEPDVKHYSVPNGNSISVDKAGSVWVGDKWVNQDAQGNFYQVEKNTGKQLGKPMPIDELIQNPIVLGAYKQIKGIKTEPTLPTAMGATPTTGVPQPVPTTPGPTLVNEGPRLPAAKEQKGLGAAPPTPEKAQSKAPLAQPTSVSPKNESVSSATKGGSVDVPKANKVMQEASKKQDVSLGKSVSPGVEYAKRRNELMMDYYSSAKDTADYYKKRFQETGNKYFFDLYQQAHQKMSAVFKAYGEGNLEQWASAASRGDVDTMRYAYVMMNPDAPDVQFKAIQGPKGAISSFEVYSGNSLVNTIPAELISNYANADTLKELKATTTKLYEKQYEITLTKNLESDIEKLKLQSAQTVAQINAGGRIAASQIMAQSMNERSALNGLLALVNGKGSFKDVQTGKVSEDTSAKPFLLGAYATARDAGNTPDVAFKIAQDALVNEKNLIFNPTNPDIVGLTADELEKQFQQ